MSILPIDQGIEHSAGASFAPNPIYFDPENIVKLAIEGGCNAIASTIGVLGAVSRKCAHKFPFIVKLNHNELLTYPNEFDQVMFGSVERALGARRRRRRRDDLLRLRREPTARSSRSHARSRRPTGSGMFTVLWCYLRNTASRSTASTTTSPPTSRARPTTWA